MRVIAAHNEVSGERQLSTSGGIFPMLATKVIKSGGVVYGVGFDDDWKVTHRRVDRIGDVTPLCSSKYVYSSIGNAIDEALDDLRDGRQVLFSGTPCQIAAIRKRAGDADGLLLVEVVCHGAPQPKYWERYLDELCAKYKLTRNDIASINFRDKSTGWRGYSFTVKFKNGKVLSQRASDNLYMRAFLSDLTLRRGCFKCPFKYPDGSKADVTLGDFWGIEKIAPHISDNLGTSMVIARTSAGEAAISEIIPDGEFDLMQAARYNPAIIKPAVMPAKYTQFESEASTLPIMKAFQKYTKLKLRACLKKMIRRTIYFFRK